MKLEQQVCSLELAQKLKELGVKQESLFYWTYSNMFGNITFYLQYFPEIEGGYDGLENDVSAFTVAELGEMLPEGITTHKLSPEEQKHLNKKTWWCYDGKKNYTAMFTCDAYESGIIDPTKVVRSALENAAAAAVTLLMTDCV